MGKTLLAAKEQCLKDQLLQLKTVMIAYSGGVDSSLLSYYARLALGQNAIIVIAVSPSLAEDELVFARVQAKQFSWDLVEIETDEVDKSEYQKNDAMRCYYCKNTLFDAMQELSQKLNIKNLAYGANMDDLSDFRPGHLAASEYNVFSPLQDAKLSKEEIRLLAKSAGLPSWNRPQAACLSSRFETFTPITLHGLSTVDKAEQVLKALGFKQVRVRHHDKLARIEVDQQEVHLLLTDLNLRNKITEQLKDLGYLYVTIDLEGYRQGSANVAVGSGK
jgi:uncharacterized protein